MTVFKIIAIITTFNISFFLYINQFYSWNKNKHPYQKIEGMKRKKEQCPLSQWIIPISLLHLDMRSHPHVPKQVYLISRVVYMSLCNHSLWHLDTVLELCISHTQKKKDLEKVQWEFIQSRKCDTCQNENHIKNTITDYK